MQEFLSYSECAKLFEFDFQDYIHHFGCAAPRIRVYHPPWCNQFCADCALVRTFQYFVLCILRKFPWRPLEGSFLRRTIEALDYWHYCVQQNKTVWTKVKNICHLIVWFMYVQWNLVMHSMHRKLISEAQTCFRFLDEQTKLCNFNFHLKYQHKEIFFTDVGCELCEYIWTMPSSSKISLVQNYGCSSNLKSCKFSTLEMCLFLYYLH